ncbi:MAG: hypothetical protein ACKO11_12845 [Cuspidothrix sp.]
MDNLKKSLQRNFWIERVMAVTTLANLALVLFDLSYVPWRDFYFRRVPEITRLYDSIKGIEPHLDTTKYLKAIAALEEQVSQTGLNSAQAETKLADIRLLSKEMIETNPFAGSGKSGTLEKIKNRMREHIGEKSAKNAFNKFWSQEYLSENNWQQQMQFFNKKLRPGIAANYYRKIDENGEPINDFWIIDLPFTVLFTIELSGRAFLIKRKYSHLRWLEAILWRWYDLLLILPLWRWLRVIPVITRLDHSRLIDLHLVRKQLHQGILSNFAEEITEIVVVQVINQVQGSIQRGEITRWLLQSENVRSYIDINNINEIEALTGLFIKTLVNQVLPKIQPDVNEILCHSIEVACQQLPGYKNLLMFPGLGQAQVQISKQLAEKITNNIYAALTSVTKDPVAAKLSSQLIENFVASLASEIKQKQVMTEVQTLLNDFLEEVKINYVQRLSTEDIDKILEQTRKMRTES